MKAICRFRDFQGLFFELIMADHESGLSQFEDLILMRKEEAKNYHLRSLVNLSRACYIK